MRKPYENKKAYDAGRLRHKIQFVQDIATDNGSGGTRLTEEVILETWAGKDDPSQYTQNGLNFGKTEYNTYQYFVIRNRVGFFPVKDMRIVYGEEKYIVQSVTKIDDPCTFLKALCVVSV